MKKAVFFVLLALLAGTPLFAQSTTEGAIGGVVVDQSKGVLPGVTVNARNVATNAVATTTTDESGHFTVIRLPPGTYAVDVALSGFAPYTRSTVVVEVGRVTNLDITLGVAAQTESVNVVAETPVINRETADLSTNINQTSLNNLPVSARRWSNFVLSTPGAAPDGTFGLISFRGISGLLNNNTVDGGDNTQAFFAEERGRTRLSYSLSLAAVQEFQVTTSNYSAEYGRAAGGVVNAVTKSGANRVSGEGFYFFRDNSMGASNPFTTQAQLQPDGTFATVRIKPDDRRQQYGLGVGGPIKKDKVFFFFNVDQQKRNFPGTAVPSNPTAFFAPLSAAEITTLAGRGVTAAQGADGLAFLQSLTGVVARTGDQTLVLPKIDWQINDKNSFAVSYNHLRWKSPAGVQTAATVARAVDNWGDDGVDGDWVISRLNSVLSSKFTNEIRFQWGRDFEYQTSQPAITGEPVALNGRSPDVTIGGTAAFEFGKPNFLERTSYPDERRVQVMDTATWLANTHLLKFGVDINRTNDTLDNLFQEGGVYAYLSRADFISDYELNIKLARAARNYSTFSQGIGPTAFTFATVDYAAFVQDSWHATPRVTLNLGLRYEYQQMPDPQIANPLEPRTGVIPADKNNWGPRIGVNWDARGDGNTVVRGGYGLFYGRIINSTISNAITNTGMANGQLSLSFGPTVAGAPLYPNILASGSATPVRPNIVFFEPDTQNPTIHQFDLIFDQKIAPNTVLSVSYVGSQGRHLPVFLDQNLPAASGTLSYSVSGGPLDGQAQVVPIFTGVRPNANFSQMTQITYGVDTAYNALVLALNRRLTRGLQVQANYTFSRSRDNGQSSQTFTAANNVLNPFDLNAEESVSNFDVPHRFSVSAVWQPHSDNVWLDGFTVAPIISASSGAPYTGFVSGNAPPANRIFTGILGNGGTNRIPSVGRNSFRLPYQTNVDLRIARSFSLPGRTKIEVLAEAFNLFNRINYTAVNQTFYTIGGTATAATLTYNAATFGSFTNANSGTFAPRPREIQLGARVTF